MLEEAPEELNIAVLLDINTKLSTNRERPSYAEILAEIWGKVVQEETNDINVVYDEPQPLSALEVNRAIEGLEQLILLCDEGDNLRTFLAKVNTYSQSAIVKRKKANNLQ